MDPIRADLISYPWNARILDATGRARYCRLLVSKDSFRKYPSPLPRPLAKRLTRRMELAIARPWALSSGLLIVAMLFLPPAIIPDRTARLNDPIWVSGWTAIYIVCAALYFTIGSVPLRRTYRRAHTAALLEARRCPWCLYDLVSIPPNDHDLTTCPECGGVWQIPSAHSPPGAPR